MTRGTISITSIDLGPSCEPLCDNDQDLFEHFLFRNYDVNDPPTVWSLSDVSTGQVFVQGESMPNEDNYALEHARTCIPQGSCLSFTLGREDWLENSWASYSYSLSLAGVSYRNIGLFLDSSENKTMVTTFLGACNAGRVSLDLARRFLGSDRPECGRYGFYRSDARGNPGNC